jgi:ribosome maturation factor RimP
MIRKEELQALFAPLLEGSDIELVQVQVVPGHKQHQLRIFVDRPGGIDIGACARLSREIARRLEERLDLRGGYRLEVSSPGLNRPIWTLEHYRRFLGDRLQFDLVEPRDGRTRYQGTIAAVDGESVTLEAETGETFTLALNEIASATLDLDPWKGRRP